MTAIVIRVEIAQESDPRKLRRIGQSLEAIVAEAVNLTGRRRVSVVLELEDGSEHTLAGAPAEDAPESSFVADQAALAGGAE